MKTFGFILYGLWSVLTVVAQPRQISYLALREGLSNVHVLDVAHDNRGFIWVATELGLNRFASHSFRPYYKSEQVDGSSVNSNEINKLLYDRERDLLYIGTRTSGLNILDLATNRFSYHIHDPDDPTSIATNDITDIIKGNDGNLWIATYHQGLQKFDVEKRTFLRYNQSTLKGLVSNSIWSLTEDRSGILYIGHVNDGLTIFDPVRQTTERLTSASTGGLLPHDEVQVVFCDSNNNIWIGTRKGLAVYNPTAKTVQRIPLEISSKNQTPFIYTLQEIEGNIWVGAESSYLFIVPKDYLWNTSKESEIISWDLTLGSNTFIRKVLPDQFGNIWLGAYGTGLGFISHVPPFFQALLTGRNVRTNDKTSVSGLSIDQNGSLWVATEGEGLLYRTDKTTKSYTTQNSGLKHNFLYTVYRDSRGWLWCGLYGGGLSIYDPKTERWDYKDENGRLTEVRVIAEGRRQRIWIGAKDGLFVFDPRGNNIRHIIINNATLGDYAARAIVEDERGNMWVGTYGQGIYVYNENGELLRHVTKTDGLASNTINHLYKDRKGNIWAATNDGIARFSANDQWNKVEQVSYPKKQVSMFIHAIAEDLQGNIWCSTSSGILRYLVGEERFLSYDQAFGIPSGGFKNNSVATDSQGRLFFGSQTGITFFDPTQVPLKFPKPPLSFSRFAVFDTKDAYTFKEKYLSGETELQLEHTENTFRVEFSAMDYALHGLLEYGYKLEGLDDDWHAVGEQQVLEFRDLPYGKYELRIRARFKNDEWDSDYIATKLEIIPPFYWSTYAKIFYALLLLSILGAILLFYLRKIKLENELNLEKVQHEQQQHLYTERLNFFTNITHELRTPLTLILGPLEDLRNEGKLPAKQMQKVEVVQKSANRLFSLVNQLLEFRKVEFQHKALVLGEGFLGDLVKEVTTKYIELSTNKELEICYRIPNNDLKTRFDMEIMNIIIDNLISNAYKYTRSGTVVVELRYGKEDPLSHYAEISVKDTGAGLSSEHAERVFERFYQVPEAALVGNGTGLGLSLVKDLVAIHQGRIQLSSEQGKGSEFLVRIPVSVVDQPVNSQPEVLNLKDSDDKHPLIILVVEDDSDLRTYIASALQNQYDVLEAENGQTGLDLAKAHIPDMIISDVMMPNMDGFEMAQKIRTTKSTSHIPIVLLTAKDSNQDRQKGYQIGVDSYLTKPVTPNLLLDRIQNILSQRKMIYEYMMETNAQQADAVAPVPQEALPWQENEFIREIIAFIEQHIEDDVMDAHTLASEMNMSHSTLYRKLKALTGKNINQFVRQIRIRKAAELLRTKQYNVTEVSFMVGINSSIYFRQCFKEELGILPSEYLKKHSG